MCDPSNNADGDRNRFEDLDPPQDEDDAYERSQLDREFDEMEAYQRKQDEVDGIMHGIFRETLEDIGGGLKKAWDDETAMMKKQAE